jgi:hypothetical protein
MIPSADNLTAEIEDTLGDQLNEDDRAELDLWEKGRELQSIVNTRGFDILLETLQAYVDKANVSLISMAPGDPDVVAAHAAVSAANQLVSYFKQDINAAVEASHKSPAALKRAAGIQS